MPTQNNTTNADELVLKIDNGIVLTDEHITEKEDKKVIETNDDRIVFTKEKPAMIDNDNGEQDTVAKNTIDDASTTINNEQAANQTELQYYPELRPEDLTNEEIVEVMTSILNKMQDKGLTLTEAENTLRALVPDIDLIITTEEDIRKIKNAPVIKYCGHVGDTPLYNSTLTQFAQALNEEANKKRKSFVFSAVSPRMYDRFVKVLYNKADTINNLSDVPTIIKADSLIACHFLNNDKIDVKVYETYSIDEEQPVNFWKSFAFSTGINMNVEAEATKKKTISNNKWNTRICKVLNWLFGASTLVCFLLGLMLLLNQGNILMFLLSLLMCFLWGRSNQGFYPLFDLVEGVFTPLFDVMDGRAAHIAIVTQDILKQAEETLTPVKVSLCARRLAKQSKFTPIIMTFILVYLLMVLVSAGGLEAFNATMFSETIQSTQSTSKSIWD